MEVQLNSAVDETLSIDASPIADWIDQEWSGAGNDPRVEQLGAAAAEAAHGLEGVLDMLINDECNREDAATGDGIAYGALSPAARGRLRAAARALSGKVNDDLDALRRRLQAGGAG